MNWKITKNFLNGNVNGKWNSKTSSGEKKNLHDYTFVWKFPTRIVLFIFTMKRNSNLATTVHIISCVLLQHLLFTVHFVKFLFYFVEIYVFLVSQHWHDVYVVNEHRFRWQNGLWLKWILFFSLSLWNGHIDVKFRNGTIRQNSFIVGSIILSDECEFLIVFAIFVAFRQIQLKAIYFDEMQPTRNCLECHNKPPPG